jgi:hypothetical protein
VQVFWQNANTGDTTWENPITEHDIVILRQRQAKHLAYLVPELADADLVPFASGEVTGEAASGAGAGAGAGAAAAGAGAGAGSAGYGAGGAGYGYDDYDAPSSGWDVDYQALATASGYNSPED